MASVRAFRPAMAAKSSSAGVPADASGSAPERTSTPAPPKASPAPLAPLRRRADFVKAREGASAALPGLILQIRRRPAEDGPDTPRVGFTATKKLGSAVIRNRVRRRLRAAAAALLPGRAEPRTDYVLIGRADTAARPFADLLADLAQALERVHTRKRKGGGRQDPAPRETRTRDR